MGLKEFRSMIVADLMAKSISLSYAMYICRDIVFRKISTFYISFRETWENINVGIKLMFANIASMLIIGVVRLGIERSWDVSTFGKVSLTLNISNLMMIFINAIGIVIFPILKRTEESKLPQIYVNMRTMLMVPLLGVLLAYYPLRLLLTAWLPQYADSLVYMAILFPMCIYEGKMALLINTYLKALRQEKMMLKINLASLLISALSSVVTAVMLKNLDLAVLSIVFILAFRCIIAELYLAKILEISSYKDIYLELAMTVVFILTGWFINSLLTVGLYAGAYLIYVAFKRDEITSTIKNLRLLMTDQEVLTV